MNAFFYFSKFSLKKYLKNNIEHLGFYGKLRIKYVKGICNFPLGPFGEYHMYSNILEHCNIHRADIYTEVESFTITFESHIKKNVKLYDSHIVAECECECNKSDKNLPQLDSLIVDMKT